MRESPRQRLNQIVRQPVSWENRSAVADAARNFRVASRENRGICDLLSLGWVPFGVPNRAPFWYAIFVAISKLSDKGSVDVIPAVRKRVGLSINQAWY